jgi:hypothetical protein
MGCMGPCGLGICERIADADSVRTGKMFAFEFVPQY